MFPYIKGRGAQISPENKFSNLYYSKEKDDHPPESYTKPITRIFTENSRNILSKNDSPDIPFTYSLNPYQGCEHGCIYCYARNTHEFWGYNAGLDFETKIISKPDAPELLRKKFISKSWNPEKIVLSGNTDCYQPVERKLKITRKLLAIFLEFGNPVGIITKNVLVLRDIDILSCLAKENLVHVILSITTLDEKIRQKLEPRTASGFKKLKAVEKLSKKGIPVSVMLSPVIPGINNHEIPSIIRESASAGAQDINMTLIRLNGVIGMIFKDWIIKNYPERAEKIWNQIKSLHNGKVNESRWRYRMKGDGPLAHSLWYLFKTIKSHYFPKNISNSMSTNQFRRHGMKPLF